MFSEPRMISKDSVPDISACTFISIEGDDISFCSQISKSCICAMLDSQLADVKSGKKRLLLAWRGDWRTDIFEVTPNTVGILRDALIEYGRFRYKTFKY